MAIKKCASDLSPYVRKSACLAIPKAFILDPELKEELSEIIEKLLGDNNTMVLGAAMFAFNEVCPNNWEIIHPHYRKLCKYLVDCEEWGQIAIIGVLTRYGRTQFVSPFSERAFQKQQFYSDDENSEDEDPLKADGNPADFDLAADHRLLLTSTFPLLRTRNPAVVLSVASLYYHLAPQLECVKVVTPLLRLTRLQRENQYIVLSNVATMAKDRPMMFTGSLKEFYVFSSDPLFIKQLKLEILSLLATEATVHQILKEFRVCRLCDNSYIQY
jgi:AP-3 complex subunit beta